MSIVRLTLYVAGNTPRTETAVANLRRLCESEFDGAEFSVVDVVESPERAESARILTTPTLVREHPAPRRRVTGDLSNPDQVIEGLGLRNAALDPRKQGTNRAHPEKLGSPPPLSGPGP